MIHDSFPKQGTERKAHEGSQSKTGTELAGDVVDFPKSMKESDQQRIKSSKQPPPATGTSKPILFPGVKD